jgi:hypothetical protein
MALALDFESILSSEERDCMRHTLSRAFTLGRVIGILAVGAAALALPGTSTGRPARAARAADQPQPLGTIVVPGGQTQPIPFGVEFKKGESYRIVASGSVTHRFYDYPNHDPTQPAVYSGSVTFDPLFCYAGDGYIGYGRSCSPPAPVGRDWGNVVLSSQVIVGAQIQSDQPLWAGVSPNFFDRNIGYDPSNTYELVWTPQADNTKLAFYDKWMDSSNNAGYSVSAGAWTIKIYGPSTETVKFGVSEKGHHPGEGKAFVRTSTLGVGQVVVPAPQENELKVTATSAKGTIVFQKLKVSPHGIRLFDDTVKLAVKGADFYPFGIPGAEYALKLAVSVTKSLDTVTISDGGSIPNASDKLHIGIAKCGLNDAFFGKDGGGEGKYGHVTVAITVVKPQPPA